MRHGIAEPLDDADFNAPDDFHRALTRKGRKRARRAALGVRELVPHLDFLASSPKTRARQTAILARDVWGKKAPPLTEWSELMEDESAAILQKLRALDAKTKDSNCVLLCGHEPFLSRLISKLLTNSPDILEIEMKKAGVCALEIEFGPQKMKRDSPGNSMPQKMKLLWHLTPKQLRKIGEQPNR